MTKSGMRSSGVRRSGVICAAVVTVVFLAVPAQGKGRFKGLRTRVQTLKTRVANAVKPRMERAGGVRNLRTKAASAVKTRVDRFRELNRLDSALSTKIRALQQQARAERKQHKDPSATLSSLRKHRRARGELRSGRFSNGLGSIGGAIGVVGVGLGVATGGAATVGTGLFNVGIGALNRWTGRSSIAGAAGRAAGLGVPVEPQLKQMAVKPLTRSRARLQRKQQRLEQVKVKHERWSQGGNLALGALGKLMVKRDDRRMKRVESRLQNVQTSLDALQGPPQPTEP